MKMNNDIIHSVAMHLESDGSRIHSKIKEAQASEKTRKLRIANIASILEKRINKRPTYESLLRKNVIKVETEMSFSKIHEFLNNIVVAPMCNTRIAPKIAERVKRLDFYLKKKILINKLEIEEYEKMFKKKEE